MDPRWARLVTRWTDAGLLDQETAARIRAYEQERARGTGLRWPIRLALAFGALMLGAGVLLFVSAHWDALSPGTRFALVLVLVAAFHVAAATTADRFPAMAVALHAVGTLTLGAGIFLGGQIFNLAEHWPGGLLLWSVGAAIAWLVLRDGPQLALVASLVPAWLSAEWFVATEEDASLGGPRVLACGLFLLSLAYFTVVGRESTRPQGRALLWLGGIALPPTALFLAAMSSPGAFLGAAAQAPGLSSTWVLGWTVALGAPLIVAGVARRVDAWPIALAIGWVLVLAGLRPVEGNVLPYVWWGLGATGLTAWGVLDARAERINMGSAMFATTVLAFYFSEVMDKLGRSASLFGLGLLFLAGGWTLERVRRRLVARVRGGRV